MKPPPLSANSADTLPLRWRGSYFGDNTSALIKKGAHSDETPSLLRDVHAYSMDREGFLL